MCKVDVALIVTEMQFALDVIMLKPDILAFKLISYYLRAEYLLVFYCKGLECFLNIVTFLMKYTTLSAQ